MLTPIQHVPDMNQAVNALTGVKVIPIWKNILASCNERFSLHSIFFIYVLLNWLHLFAGIFPRGSQKWVHSLRIISTDLMYFQNYIRENAFKIISCWMGSSIFYGFRWKINQQYTERSHTLLRTATSCHCFFISSLSWGRSLSYGN